MRAWLRLASITALCAVLAPCLSGAQEDTGIPRWTPWVPTAERAQLQNLDIAFKDQDGRPGTLGELIDRPVLITFFYSRCLNSRKCSMAVNRMGALQRRLAEDGIDGKVRLLAITYEPQFDTPDRLNRYATDRGLRLGENALALQLDMNRHQQLVDELQAPVNYNAGWVNAHGVELSLLDGQGRLVRKYHTVLWDNEQVAKDVKEVLAGR